MALEVFPLVSYTAAFFLRCQRNNHKTQRPKLRWEDGSEWELWHIFFTYADWTEMQRPLGKSSSTMEILEFWKDLNSGTLEQSQSGKKKQKVEVNAANNVTCVETVSVTGCNIWEWTENNFCTTDQECFAEGPQILTGMMLYRSLWWMLGHWALFFCLVGALVHERSVCWSGENELVVRENENWINLQLWLSLVLLTGHLSLRAHLAMEDHLLLGAVPQDAFACKNEFKVLIRNTLNASHTNIFRKTAVSREAL